MTARPAAASVGVVGHVEWVSFVAVEELPVAGSIDRATAFLEEPAGGGAVVAVQLLLKRKPSST